MGTASCGDPADVARVLNYELNKYPASQYKSGGTRRRISHPAGLSASVQPASPAREDAVGSEREEPEYPPVSHGRRPSGGCRLEVDRRGCYTEGDAAERSAAHHVVTRCDDHRPHDEMRGPELRHIGRCDSARLTPTAPRPSHGKTHRNTANYLMGCPFGPESAAIPSRLIPASTCDTAAVETACIRSSR
jgi:hypothetical protein